MRGSWRDVQHPGLVIGLTLAFTLGAGLAFYAGWSENRLSRASEKTTCTVLQTRVYESVDSEGSSQGHFPEVTILHEAGGQRYERVDRGPRALSDSAAREVTSRYAVGSAHACAFIAGEPESVVLFPRSASAGWPYAFLGAMLLVLCGVFYFIERRRFAKEGPARRPAGTKQSPLVVGVAVAAGVAMVGVLLFVQLGSSAEVPENPPLDGPSSGLIAVCAPAAGQPIAVVDKLAAKNRTDHRLSLIDPATGEVKKRVALGPLPTTCLGADGRSVWLDESGRGVIARSVDTGEVVKVQADLETAIGAKVTSAQADRKTGHLVVTSDAGKKLFVADDFTTRPVGANDVLAFPNPGLDHPVGRLVVRDLHPAYPTAEGSFRTEGHPDRAIFLDDRAIGDRRWERPQFVLDVETRSLVWPDPPSLIVCEPNREMDEKKKRITVSRLTLTGDVLWTYTPGEPSLGNPHECNWYGAGTRAHLAYFTQDNAVVGVDASNGREIYRTKL